MRNYLKFFAIAALVATAALSCEKDQDNGKNPVELSSGETANCYIVTGEGCYSFPAVRGNSNEAVGDIRSAEVLWESFGSKVEPKAGDLVSEVTYKKGKILFNASGKKGNAVIAAKDGNGTILWSWHIWLTDSPKRPSMTLARLVGGCLTAARAESGPRHSGPQKRTGKAMAALLPEIRV